MKKHTQTSIQDKPPTTVKDGCNIKENHHSPANFPPSLFALAAATINGNNINPNLIPNISKKRRLLTSASENVPNKFFNEKKEQSSTINFSHDAERQIAEHFKQLTINKK